MKKREVVAKRKDSANRLVQFSQDGIQWVQILEANIEEAECQACVALRGKTIPIGEAKPLPLPGCDAEFCGCIYTAHLEAK